MPSNHCLCKYFMVTLGGLPADPREPIEVVAFVYAADADDARRTTRAYLAERGRPHDAIVAFELGRAGLA